MNMQAEFAQEDGNRKQSKSYSGSFGEGELQLLELIGQGGNGEVYRGVTFSPKGEAQTVAVKIVPSKSFCATKAKEKTFCNVMMTLLSLEHPNLLRLDSIYNNHGKAAFVSELCEGLDVVKLIQLHDPGTVNIRLCVKVFRDLLVGMSYLHDQGIIHCDIKLDNLKFRTAGGDCVKLGKGSMALLDRVPLMLKDDVVILDLDSCLMESDVVKVREESNRIARGTFQYMPPEAFKGVYSKAGDMFSAAVTLYCLLDGHFPFRVRPGMSVEELIQAVSTTPKFKPHIWSRLPGAEATVRALLDSVPSRRPTAKQVLETPWFMRACQNILDISPGLSPCSTPNQQYMRPPLSIIVPRDSTSNEREESTPSTPHTPSLASIKGRKNVTFDESVTTISASKRQECGSLGNMSPVRPIFAVPASSLASPNKKPNAMLPQSPKTTRKHLGALSLLYKLTRGRLGCKDGSRDDRRKGSYGFLPALLRPFGVSHYDSTDGSNSEKDATESEYTQRSSRGNLSPFSASMSNSPTRRGGGHARSHSLK